MTDTQNPESSIFRFTLPNGLRVIHGYDPSQAMAVVDVLYKVGSCDEHPDRTGMAHLFEHLMFGGSVNIENFDGELTDAGGQSNAWTSPDFTNFYDIVPAANIETALWLESDRMLSPAFSDKALEVQRQVVVEEFKQVCLNRPYGNSDHLLREMCYKVHPYGHPVIGKDFSHIEQVTQDRVRQWFAAHYAPNNAVLAVVGNVEPAQLRSLVEKWFGSIPARDITPRNCPAEPEPTEARVTETSGKVPHTAITMAFPIPAYGTPGYAAADAISDILSNGRSSRFYRRLLLPGEHFSEIDAAITGSEEPGLLVITAQLLNEGSEAEKKAIAAIRRVLDELAAEGPGERELERVKNTVESDRTFSLLPLVQRAQAYALAEMHREEPTAPMARYRALTTDDIREAARTLLRPERSRTLIYRPENA